MPYRSIYTMCILLAALISCGKRTVDSSQSQNTSTGDLFIPDSSSVFDSQGVHINPNKLRSAIYEYINIITDGDLDEYFTLCPKKFVDSLSQKDKDWMIRTLSIRQENGVEPVSDPFKEYRIYYNALPYSKHRIPKKIESRLQDKLDVIQVKIEGFPSSDTTDMLFLVYIEGKYQLVFILPPESVRDSLTAGAKLNNDHIALLNSLTKDTMDVPWIRIK